MQCIYPTMHYYRGVSMSENKFSVKVPHYLLAPKLLKDAIYLATCIHLKIRHETTVKWPTLRQEQESKVAHYSFVARRK